MKQLRIVKLGFLQWRQNPKYFVSVLFLIMFAYNRLNGMTAYARALGAKVTPFLFPFLPHWMITYLPLMLAFVLLISDAPFRTRQQQFVVLRTGKRAWISGQLLYILAVSIGFTLLLWVLSWIWMLPELDWSSQWGPVMTTAAMTGGYASYDVGLAIDYSVMKNTDPVTVTLWCMAATAAVCFFLGTVMTACNLWLKKGWGTVIVSALLAIGVIPQNNLSTPGLMKMFLWISPLSWTDWAKMGHTNVGLPSRSYGILAPLILGTVLSIVLIATIHKCNLETDKE